jgi:pimeloyl-ACP methyl ester carboxylesterase
MFAKGLIRHSPLRSLGVGAVLVATSLAVMPGQFVSAQNPAPASPARKATDSEGVKPTIVLVHGDWADASSWSGEITRLQRDGFTVVAPPNPLRGIPEDAGYVRNYLHTITGPIVLVGHSYGGAVITNAATGNANVKALVFVDAFVPKQDETLVQLLSLGPTSCLAGSAVDPTKVFNFVQDPGLPAGDLDAYLKVEATSLYPGFANCFANGLSASQAAELAATQRPAALGQLIDKTGVPAWLTIPSWYLIGKADRAVPPNLQRFMATRANAHISEFGGGHLGLISDPEAVVEIIQEAVDATSANS